MAKNSMPPWLPIVVMLVGLGSTIVAGAMGYGALQNRVDTLTGDIADLEAEFDRSKSILHQRITTAQNEISELKTSALMRVTDVEVKITKLDSKIDGYTREAQAARSEAQTTMNAILTRLQAGIGR